MLFSLPAELYCYLTTVGRVSGQPRTIEIWFAADGGTLYMLAGDGEKANWVKNAERQPRVAIRIGEQDFTAEARRVTEPAEAVRARRLVYNKYAPSEADLENWARDALPMAAQLGFAEIEIQPCRESSLPKLHVPPCSQAHSLSSGTSARTQKKNPAAELTVAGLCFYVMAGWCKSVLGRPGSDRLSRVLTRSTMGAGGFNGRVRNGIGWNSPAMTTRPAKDGFA